MKSLVSYVVGLMVLCSCSHVPFMKGGVAAEDARDSVYKIEVTMAVDITPLLPPEPPKDEAKAPEKGKKKGKKKAYSSVIEGLGLPDSTNPQILKEDKVAHTVVVGWSGTGWVAESHRNRSFLMTAGHVCETRDSFKITVWSFDEKVLDWVSKEVELKILWKKHALVSRDGVETDAKVMADEDLNEDTYEGNDMCLLGAPGNLGTALPIADEDPSYGSHAIVIGAPAGIWGGNVALTADLKFSGRGNLWGGKVAEGLAFTGDVMGGNSGSAILYGGKVVALLNLGGVEFPQATTGLPWEKIREFLRTHLHKGPKG